MSIDWKTEGDACVRLLGDLLRIDTVNRGTGGEGRDDGHEVVAADRLASFLREAGVEVRTFEKVKGRTNLVARVKGTGEKPPLLLNAHLDVVEADASAWQRPPFSGDVHDGYLWGHGAVDMKNMAAMSACVLSMLARNAGERPRLARDVILAAVADEEAGSRLGSLYMVDDHADEVRAEYMLGEVGAFSQHLFGRTFYPVQVAEKGICWVRATFEGSPGHGSMPDPDSAVVKLARAIARMGKKRMPVHPTETVRRFVAGLAEHLPAPQRQVLSKLTVPAAASLVLDYAIRDPAQRRSFGAMLSNTASPDVVTAGTKVNVIPGKATVDIDGRTLPGQTVESFLAELREVMGKEGEEAQLEVVWSLPAVETSPDTAMFRHLARTLERHHPGAHPVPYMVPGFTDAKAYDRLGTRCYGFAPVRFDPTHTDVVFSKMFHGHDERIPVDGLTWGLRVLYDAVTGA